VKILQGWLSAYSEGTWLPKWASPGPSCTTSESFVNPSPNPYPNPYPNPKPKPNPNLVSCSQPVVCDGLLCDYKYPSYENTVILVLPLPGLPVFSLFSTDVAGYRNSMIGTYGDVVFIDAMMKDIGKEGAPEGSFDYDLAWEAIRKDTFEEVPFESNVGKIGLKEYRLHGYVPSDIMYEVDGETRGPLGESVSRTLDFSFAGAYLTLFHLYEVSILCGSDFTSLKILWCSDWWNQILESTVSMTWKSNNWRKVLNHTNKCLIKTLV
jgi:hypothetical protein